MRTTTHKTKFIFLTILLLHSSSGKAVEEFFKAVNDGVIVFNQFAAVLSWTALVNPSELNSTKDVYRYLKKHLDWSEEVCSKLSALQNGRHLNSTQKRMVYLTCRGPSFHYDEFISRTRYTMELQTLYNDAKVCYLSETAPSENITRTEQSILTYITAVYKIANHLSFHYFDDVTAAVKFDISKILDAKQLVCFNGEEEVENLMKRAKNEKVLRWIWMAWREKMTSLMLQPYGQLVLIENSGARRNGYSDIGSSWRSELEWPDLKQHSRDLYYQIKPLYSMLHAVVRYHLRKKYGEVVPRRGPIPAHLLGDLWSQNWEPLIELIIPKKKLDLNQKITDLKWSVPFMLRRAEDFYQSLGLPPMTKLFWEKSLFKRKNNETRCHGTAANMFKPGDYRLLYCAGTTADDFYVIHHEMGHIHYYMAYENQPGNFRQANSALHESIGDAVMYGVLAPQHLHRLQLINDSVIYDLHRRDDDENDIDVDDRDVHDDYDNVVLEGGMKPRSVKFDVNQVSSDEILLLQTALKKLPQIPFALLIDEYRWKFFEGSMTEGKINWEFWKLAEELQGIAPPEPRSEKYFDVAAKYHVPDGTPYIRYFLSSFLQHQIFESLCKAAVYGRRGVSEDLPSSIAFHRCDIYGSKPAGKILKDIMSRGHSQHWREILRSAAGFETISASSLRRYYNPLRHLLRKMIRAYDIPVGW